MQWCISISGVPSAAVHVPPRAFRSARVPSRSPFAPGPGSVRAMSKNPKPNFPPPPVRDFVRTPLFWLLYDHHAELSETWRGSRVRWPVVCAWAAARGVADRQGKPIQPGAAKMCWRRVCAAKAEEGARQAARPRPAPAAPVRPSYAAPPRVPEPPLTDDEVQRRINSMRETIYRRSGRPWPPTD